MTIAFFDFDGTITKGDSFALFLRFILGRKFYAKLLQNLYLLVLYKMGFISNSGVKERILALREWKLANLRDFAGIFYHN